MFRRALCLGLLLIGIATSAATPPPPDFVLLVDVSGSMRKTDPAYLRRDAVALLARLLPAERALSLAVFGDRMRWLVPPASPDGRSAVLAAGPRITSTDDHTDIEQALSALLSERGSAPQEILLLTDGVVDTGDPAGSRDSRARLLADVGRTLKAQGHRLHVVGLSAGADHELLLAMARQADGSYDRAEVAADLTRIFTDIFRQSARPNEVPLEGNDFNIDASTREFTLVVPGNAAGLGLHAPDGRPVQANSPNVKWYGGQGFQLVTVIGPAVGRWQIDGAAIDGTLVQLLSDLRLRCTDAPSLATAGSRLRLDCHLEDGGVIVDDPRLLSDLTATAQLRPAQGGSAPPPQTGRPDRNGALRQDIALPDQPGRWTLEVAWRGPTLARSQQFPLTLTAPLATARPAPAPAKTAPPPAAAPISWPLLTVLMVLGNALLLGGAYVLFRKLAPNGRKPAPPRTES